MHNPPTGAMAQLGARLHGMQKVASSSLAGSSYKSLFRNDLQSADQSWGNGITLRCYTEKQFAVNALGRFPRPINTTWMPTVAEDNSE